MRSPPKVLTIVGTRPEAIKLFPVIQTLRRQGQLASLTIATGQHREMLGRTLALAGIVPDKTLEPIEDGRSLDALTARLVKGIGCYLDTECPAAVVVQGDTTSAFAGALAAHYRKVPVAHVEAGLRSGEPFHPWPEEFNRKAIAALAQWHFAPTRSARDALLAENIPENAIRVTGNTVIDALLWMRCRVMRRPELARQMQWIEQACTGRRIIAVTCHRRENLGHGVKRIAAALARLAEREDVALVVPMHPNPAVRDPFCAVLGGIANVHLVEALDYPDFVRLLEVAHCVLSDSGGVQEEAAALGTPVFLLRESTERYESLMAGTAKLVGTDPDRIVEETELLLEDPRVHAAMARIHHSYGDGKASERIVDTLAGELIR